MTIFDKQIAIFDKQTTIFDKQTTFFLKQTAIFFFLNKRYFFFKTNILTGLLFIFYINFQAESMKCLLNNTERFFYYNNIFFKTMHFKVNQ